MKPARDDLRLIFDTLLAEKAAYIRYLIRHNTGFENEQLYLKTPYGSPVIRPNHSATRRFPAYNILLFGRTDLTIWDTAPAETWQVLPVEWLHYGTDTLQYRLDSLRVQPGTTVDFPIHY